LTSIIPSVVIGLLALDTTIAFQILLSQPIFACPIVGWILGNPQLGFEVGLILQLLWLHLLPVGSSIFPEGNLASMIICAITVQFDQMPFPNLVFAIAIFIGIVVSYIGAWVTVLDRKINEVLLNLAHKSAHRVKINEINFIEALSVLIYFVLISLTAYFFLEMSGILLNFLEKFFSHSLEQRFIMIKPVMFGIGIMLTSQLIFKSIRKKLTR
jgi:PTS system mannose-specific IIC component